MNEILVIKAYFKDYECGRRPCLIVARKYLAKMIREVREALGIGSM